PGGPPMSPRKRSNLAASVRQRLLNQAKATGRPFNELLQYFAMERFLYRLGQSSHAERFILKGALMFRVWDTPLARPTKDIDVLGCVKPAAEEITHMVRDCLTLDVPDDGTRFDPAGI